MSTHVRSLRSASAALCLSALAACSFSEPTLQETRQLELDVSPDGRFVIEAGAGPIIVEGDDGTSIRIEAGIYQHAPNDDYRLALEATGEGAARLVADTPSAGFGTSDYIDLVIRIPRSLDLRIDDGSGSLQVRDLDGDLQIDDGAGSIRIASIGGTITVDDGAGSISIQDAGGDVRIDDGSGSIEVINAAGMVSIDDGSGSITVTNADDFELRGDGSGSVNLSGIRSQGG